MSDPEKSEVSLKRALGLFTSILLVMGLLIGTGVFKKIVPMAQTGIGEIAIVMAWIVAGIISLFGAYTASGLASLSEESGGLYDYFRVAFGNFLAFLTGWTFSLIIGPASLAAISFLCGDIINTIIPIPNPFQSFENVSIANEIFPFKNFGIKLVAIAGMVVLTFVNMLGTRESGVFNNIITGAKVLGILILIVVGVTYNKPGIAPAEINISPAPEGMLFFSAFFSAMLGAFWAYDGWYTAPNMAGEMINPKKNLPLALTFGIFGVMLVYTLVNYAYMNVLPLERLRAISENEIGAFVVGNALLGNYGKILLLVLFTVSVFGCLNSNLVTIPRQLFRMAQEGWFFSHIGKVHPRFRTPHVAMIYTLIVSILLLISGSFDKLTDLVIFASFMFFGLMAIALIKTKRNGMVKVKVVGYPVVPVILALFSIALTINTVWVQPKQSLMGLVLILSGVPVYYYTIKNRGSQSKK